MTEDIQSNGRSPLGKVYLVGAGPGDPGLITLRGKYLLERADTVVYDYLANSELLKHASKDAERIYVGKKGGGLHAMTQEGINSLLVEHAKKGRMVVRLKGGDPFIFGRGAEEIEELVKDDVPFEVVPGVTSATAAATYAGIPITHRDYTSSVAFITGHERPGKKTSSVDWEKLATGAGTLVIFMGIKNLEIIVGNLIKHGRSPETPAAVVRWASTPKQHTVRGTLGDIAEKVRLAGIKPPSLIVVGEVVSLRGTIDWYESRPLFGRKIVVTRTRQQASDLVTRLEEHGAACIEYPTIYIEPVKDCSVLDGAITRMDSFDWLLFTSLNAVDYFFRRLDHHGLDSRSLGSVKVGAVGKTTAEILKKHGIRVDLLPEKKYTGEGLAEALVNKGISGNCILIPRALKAREILPEILKDAWAKVTVAPLYQNVPPKGRQEELRQQLESGEIDMITFTSSSTVINFLIMTGAKNIDELLKLMSDTRIAAIGPVTAKTAEENGLKVHVQPKRYTIPDMVNAIVEYYKEQG